MTRFFFSSLCIFFFITRTFGQISSTQQLEKTLANLVQKQLKKISPGCVVLISKGDTIIYHKAFGYANVKAKIPMEKDRIFRIGSITKAFTAVAILQLVEKGKIHLQDTIQQYVKNFPVKAYPVTIENLLRQTSGIKNYFEIENPAKEKASYTPAEGVAYFQDEPLEFKPGTQYRYSNSNYYLLGYILELVTGMSYGQYVQTYLFDKVGMPSTSYADPSRPAKRMAKGYSKFGKRMEDAELEEITTIYAAGGIRSNAEDLWKWHQALFSGKLIKKETLAKAIKPFHFPDGKTSEYGYGWFLLWLDGSKTIEHSGSTDGYQSDLLYLPKEDIRVITLFNCFEADRDWVGLSNDLARVAAKKPLEDHLELSKAFLQQYVGTYRYDDEFQMIITMKRDKLYVRCPKVGLRDSRLYALKENYFYIKNAPLKFELLKDDLHGFKMITYNDSGKDAEWMKVK